MRKFWRTLKHYTVPHRGNTYHPKLLAVESLAFVVVFILLCEGAYNVQTSLVYQKTPFLASVLPGAIAALTNETRAKSGLGALTEDATLDKAAEAKAQDMVDAEYFAHVSPDGKTPWYWLQKAGYDYSYAGENLAVNFVDSSDVENAWIESPPHYANIVKSEYTRTGIGVAEGIYKGEHTVFVVQFFATPADVATPITKTVHAPAPHAPVISSETSPNARVLGAAVEPAASFSVATDAAGTTKKILTSPKFIISGILMFVVSLFFAIFLVIIFVRSQKRHAVGYVEVMSGGVAVCTLAILFLWFNSSITAPLALPLDNQSASIAVAI